MFVTKVSIPLFSDINTHKTKMKFDQNVTDFLDLIHQKGTKLTKI